MSRSTKLIIAAASIAFSSVASAAVSAEEAKQLGGAYLTLMGAEKAGNREGTIPEYAGTPVKIPNYDPNDPGYRPDPFASEKPLFTITAQNYMQYADKLDGDAEIFKKYPNYRMDIYPSHRTVWLPKYVLDNTVKNATQCRAVQNELVIEGCFGGIPFPIPKTGNQVMWNHVTAFEQLHEVYKTQAYYIPQSGNSVMLAQTAGTESYPFYEPSRTAPAEGSVSYWRVWFDYVAPTRRVGERLVLIDPMDTINHGRRAWIYLPGQRRVKLAPDLAYDTPSPTSGGSTTMDDIKTFNGSMDRYDFKLIGKKEKYVNYNNFKQGDYKGGCPMDKFLTKKFPNPDCMRWELHRVWVVEATLKPGFRHIYQKRRFYYDEDGFASGIAENFDATGRLYRIIHTLTWPFPEGGIASIAFYGLDFNDGSWAGQGLLNFPGGGLWTTKPIPDYIYSPEHLAGAGIR